MAFLEEPEKPSRHVDNNKRGCALERRNASDFKDQNKKRKFGKNRKKDAGEKSFGSRPSRPRPNALTSFSMPGGRNYHRQKARNEAKKEEKAQLRAAGLWKVWSINFCLQFA